ncbi:MAG: hypothetical protein WD226_08970 [Planctomycetota bacterium]
MNALVLLTFALLASAPTTRAPLASAESAAESAAEASVRLRAEPLAVEVGEPVTVTLELEVDEGRVLDEPFDAELAFDDTWAVLSLERAAPSRAGAGRAVTRWRWSVASLEPGERSLAPLVSALALEEGLADSAPVLTVTSVLAADAEAPRPLIGWSDSLALSGAAAPARWPWFLGAGVVALALGFVLRRYRSPRDERTPREPLGARVATLGLDRLAVASTAELRDAAFRVTALAREAVEARGGPGWPGATDDEWLGVAATGLDAATEQRLCALFRALARIKYAGERPSSLALEELAREARALFDELAQPAEEVAA